MGALLTKAWICAALFACVVAKAVSGAVSGVLDCVGLGASPRAQQTSSSARGGGGGCCGLDVVKFEFPVRGLPHDIDGLKVALLSDFHYVDKESDSSAQATTCASAAAVATAASQQTKKTPVRESCGEVSDLRIRISVQLLDKVVTTVNDFAPDVCLLGGDFVQHRGDDARVLCRRWLSRIKAPAGVFAVLGNHDQRYEGARQAVVDALQEVGISVLDNEIVYPVGDGLELIGVGDCTVPHDYRPQEAFASCREGVPKLVLTHNPDCSAELAGMARVSLQLSGHTHGGQIRLPGLGAVLPWLMLLVKPLPRFGWLKRHGTAVKHWEWAQGLCGIPRHENQVAAAVAAGGESGEGRQLLDADPSPSVHFLYVNRGLGAHPPGRLFCPPEVTCITLRSEEAE
eukprot:TRINITY_DN222_c2_g1_i2.p2 TRINITY_DN222_c2_g1~~TRINITY_DN222_c2_g1_i2.p2  ORF type:complete len:400 (+),score=77.28 TRINITY_DN222_c2_g1_i2:26-1225(+)